MTDYGDYQSEVRRLTGGLSDKYPTEVRDCYEDGATPVQAVFSTAFSTAKILSTM